MLPSITKPNTNNNYSSSVSPNQNRSYVNQYENQGFNKTQTQIIQPIICQSIISQPGSGVQNLNAAFSGLQINETYTLENQNPPTQIESPIIKKRQKGGNEDSKRNMQIQLQEINNINNNSGPNSPTLAQSIEVDTKLTKNRKILKEFGGGNSGNRDQRVKDEEISDSIVPSSCLIESNNFSPLRAKKNFPQEYQWLTDPNIHYVFCNDPLQIRGIDVERWLDASNRPFHFLNLYKCRFQTFPHDEGKIENEKVVRIAQQFSKNRGFSRVSDLLPWDNFQDSYDYTNPQYLLKDRNFQGFYQYINDYREGVRRKNFGRKKQILKQSVSLVLQSETGMQSKNFNIPNNDDHKTSFPSITQKNSIHSNNYSIVSGSINGSLQTNQQKNSDDENTAAGNLDESFLVKQFTYEAPLQGAGGQKVNDLSQSLQQNVSSYYANSNRTTASNLNNSFDQRDSYNNFKNNVPRYNPIQNSDSPNSGINANNSFTTAINNNNSMTVRQQYLYKNENSNIEQPVNQLPVMNNYNITNNSSTITPFNGFRPIKQKNSFQQTQFPPSFNNGYSNNINNSNLVPQNFTNNSPPGNTIYQGGSNNGPNHRGRPDSPSRAEKATIQNRSYGATQRETANQSRLSPMRLTKGMFVAQNDPEIIQINNNNIYPVERGHESRQTFQGIVNKTININAILNLRPTKDDKQYMREGNSYRNQPYSFEKNGFDPEPQTLTTRNNNFYNIPNNNLNNTIINNKDSPTTAQKFNVNPYSNSQNPSIDQREPNNRYNGGFSVYKINNNNNNSNGYNVQGNYPNASGNSSNMWGNQDNQLII